MQLSLTHSTLRIADLILITGISCCCSSPWSKKSYSKFKRPLSRNRLINRILLIRQLSHTDINAVEKKSKRSGKRTGTRRINLNIYDEFHTFHVPFSKYCHGHMQWPRSPEKQRQARFFSIILLLIRWGEPNNIHSNFLEGVDLRRT